MSRNRSSIFQPAQPFRLETRSERLTRLIGTAISQVDLGVDALSGLQIDFRLRIPESVLGLADEDYAVVEAILRQMAEVCAAAADGGAGVAVLA